jgi:hypothetical protein
MSIWTGFKWLRVGSNDVVSWTWFLEVGYCLTDSLTISFLRKSLYHKFRTWNGVSPRTNTNALSASSLSRCRNSKWYLPNSWQYDAVWRTTHFVEREPDYAAHPEVHNSVSRPPKGRKNLNALVNWGRCEVRPAFLPAFRAQCVVTRSLDSLHRRRRGRKWLLRSPVDSRLWPSLDPPEGSWGGTTCSKRKTIFRFMPMCVGERQMASYRNTRTHRLSSLFV